MDEPKSSIWSTRLWVGRWQSGESDALGELAERFSPLLRARIRSSRHFGPIASQVTVDDVEQEAWARVLRSPLQAFTPNGSGSFVAWLAGIADHTMQDLARRQHALKRGSANAPLDSLADRTARPVPGDAPRPSPTAEVRVSEFEDLARAALNERELEAWRWVALEGYTSEEAALGLDCTPAAVRSLLVRSRRKLKEALDERKTGGA